MGRYLVRRVLAFIPTILLVYTIVFVLMHATPGGPWDDIGRGRLLPEVKANLDKKYHLDDPLPQQYVNYLVGAVQGDLGPSYRTQARTVADIIGDFFPVSFQLGLLAMLIAVSVGVPLGLVAAAKKDSWVDRLVMFSAVVGISTPSFVVATVLIVVFAVQLHWVPTLGWNGIFSTRAIIPAVSLAIPAIAALARYTRSSMLEVIRADYIRTARSKGLREITIVLRHAAKNALIPVITVTGIYFAFVVTGSFYVEVITGVPGLGRYFVTAIAARDYPVIMGTTLLFALIVMVMNLVVDIAYAFVDPRIRYG